MTARQAGAVAVGSVVATALLLVVLAAWAATIGPSDVLTGPGPQPASPTTAPTATATPTNEAPPVVEPPPRSHRTPAWVRALAVAVNVAALLLAGYLLLRYAGRPALAGWRVRWRRRRRGGRGAHHEPEIEVLAPSRAVAQEMVADARAQRAELLGDTPRNAVVACWHRFESQGEAAGLVRRPWETSSEFAIRVLDLVEAYQPAVSRLAALYREARFSEHELTEEHRQEALAALDEIHRTVGAMT